MQVTGYVKAASKHGVFVSLAKDLDVRVKMSNLADSFVEDASLAFPVGKRVQGHIISVSQDKYIHISTHHNLLARSNSPDFSSSCQ